MPHEVVFSPETSNRLALAANDNGTNTSDPVDPHIRRIAEAIGRHLAREYMRLRARIPKMHQMTITCKYF
ncbi:hypothetical protein SAMN04244559_02216 [Magnetospirillum fulvum]|uniref:Uncharacterized protein n=1 Tax=Magnetospirillum fulvum TaxID=1082 RepID=A0A1H6I5P8_MAGFU|nr:hypothetical protein SAMN04244559_02216 [Magnetospirillum fulvum]